MFRASQRGHGRLPGQQLPLAVGMGDGGTETPQAPKTKDFLR